MKRWIIAFGLLLALVFPAYAAELKVGQVVPAASVKEKGRLVVQYEMVDNKMAYKADTDIGYQPWSTAQLKGKVRTVYHLAGRIGIDEINAHYIDALIAADLDQKRPDSPYQTTTVLNTDDALWGTAGIAKSRMEGSQKEFPHAQYVIDDEGAVLEAWGLQKKNSAVIILDAESKVLWFKEGKLTDAEVKEAVNAIKKALAELKGESE